MNQSVLELVRDLEGTLLSGSPSLEWSGVSIDTRTIKPRNVFFALRGPRFDGHQFVASAVKKQAAVLVVDHPITIEQPTSSSVAVVQVPDTLRALQALGAATRNRASKTIFIGLTGSNGKTTTKEMLSLILRRVGRMLTTRGNLNNHIGLPLMLTELRGDERFALLELGTSMPGDMDVLLDCLSPTVGLITNVGKDHLEFFGTPEGVLNENRKLYDRLGPKGIAVINLEDPLIKGCVSSLSGKKVTFGLTPNAEVSVTDIHLHPGPLRFELRMGKVWRTVTMQTQGIIQVMNALAAAAVAHALGISPDEIVAGLGTFKASAMRMEVQNLKDGSVIVLDAYNANPSSMRAAIDSFGASYPDRSRWLVLSDMRELGGGARQEHHDLGAWITGQPVDRVFLYGRDARFIEQGMRGKTFTGVVERFKKKRYLVESLKRALSETSQKPALLFKASRRMKLEQVSNALSSL